MGRLMAVGARLGTAALLTLGLMAGPGSAASTALGKAADCPAPPVTIAKLVHLDASGDACFGGRVLVFRAYVAPPCDECGGTNATVIAPRWLDGLLGSEVNLSAAPGGPQVAVFIPPALGRCHLTHDAACPFHPFREQWATVTARFDAPVAQTCHYRVKPAGGGFTRADAVAACQAKLVVLSVGPDSNPATDTASAAAAAVVPGTSTGSPAMPIAIGCALVVGVSAVARRRPSRR